MQIYNDGVNWILREYEWETYNLVIRDNTSEPTEQEIEDIFNSSYIVNRKAEYPEWTDFADAWVKDDQPAMDKYRADCLAVKAKFPKPM